MTTAHLIAVGSSPLGKTDLPGRDLFSKALAEAFGELPDPAQQLHPALAERPALLFVGRLVENKRQHLLLEVLWHTGIRIGAECGLDVDDYNPDKQYLELAHRPDSGTALKNQKQGERLVALSDRVCAVLDDWLDVNHPGSVDEYGRKPLFVTRHGRLSRNRGRTIAYQYTRPCVYTDECPHDRDLETCDALQTSRVHECPSVLSPHPIRRGSITYHLRADTPKEVVGSRMDLGMDVLEQHYDQRTPEEKLNQRRQYLPEK